MSTKTVCKCGHPIHSHTYSEDFSGCDEKNCDCSLDLGEMIDSLSEDKKDLEELSTQTLQDLAKILYKSMYEEPITITRTEADAIAEKYWDTWEDVKKEMEGK